MCNLLWPSILRWPWQRHPRVVPALCEPLPSLAVLSCSRFLRRSKTPQSTTRISFFRTVALTCDRFACFAVNVAFFT
jgi:hypothetical protein